MKHLLLALPLALALLAASSPSHGQAPAGEIKGSAWAHTAESRSLVLANASVALPAAVTGAAVFSGKLSAAPKDVRAKAPVVLFLHGSSGLGLAAIGEWQAWLAAQGIASIAPDSMGLPGRILYKSPIDKATYEKVHALRQSEVDIVLEALPSLPWADTSRIVLAGTSEGGVPVARHGGRFAGRMIFSWSCEDNYFVEAHQTHAIAEPVLNVISSVDPFFSPANAWLGNAAAQGHCGAALKAHKNATIVLVPGAPHTLLNLPQPRQVVKAWLADLWRPTP
jgi:dienelactone hydrolase